MKLTGKLLCVAVFAFSLSAASAQNKKNQKPEPNPEPKAETPAKRNERPGGAPAKAEPPTAEQPATHFYEFTRPGFSYGKVVIEHNDAGRGTISFLKDGYEELLTDPISLTTATLAKIDGALSELNFLDSTDEYQYSKDYTHMGNVTFTLRRDGRSRTVKYNWTENKAAKTVMDEYRRISNEYTWRFEMVIARQNQPLQTPGLMDAIDSYLKRNEISDPANLLPFLRELSTDERIPLMARNRAAKLAKEIDKPAR